MKRYKATFAGRIVLFAIIIAVVVGCVFGVSSFIKSNDEPAKVTTTNNNKNNIIKPTVVNNNNVEEEDVTINLSLDEWIGWEPILYANQGF